MTGEREALARVPERFRFNREVYGDVADDATRVLLAITDGGHGILPDDNLRWIAITAAQALAARPAPANDVSRVLPDGTYTLTIADGRSEVRPAPAVSGEAVERAAQTIDAGAFVGPAGFNAPGMAQRRSVARSQAHEVVAALGLTVADEGSRVSPITLTDVDRVVADRCTYPGALVVPERADEGMAEA